MNQWCCSLVVAVAFACPMSAAAQDASPSPEASAPSARQTIPPIRVEADLKALVADALDRNLPLLAERVVPEVAQAGTRAARGAFEPAVQFSPGLGRGSQTTETASGPVKSTTSRFWYGNAVSGALPYSTLSVAGELPTGTTYDVAFDSNRRGEFPAQLQEHGVEVDSRLTVSFAQPLLRGAGTSIARADIRSADLAALAATRRYERVAEETVAAVERAYWELAFADATEAMERESLERATALLGRNQRLVALGLTAQVDLLTSRQAVAAREAAVTEAVRSRRDAAERLVFLVYGRQATDRLAVAEGLRVSAPVVAPVVPAVDEAEAEALKRRADLAAAREEVAISSVRVEVARSDLKPSLQLTGSYTAAASNAANLRLWGTDRVGDLAVTGWQGGLVFTVPVGNAVGKAGYRQALLGRSQQELAVSALENDIRLAVRQASRAITEGARRLTQAEEALTLARLQYDAETKRLELGLSDSFRLLQFEQLVADAQGAAIQARYALAFAISDYNLAVGGNTQRYLAAGPSH
jgi:outer membrane protein TolC